jgi:hypothetical protein
LYSQISTNKVRLNYFLVILVLVLEVTIFFDSTNFPIPGTPSLISLAILMLLFFNRIGEVEIKFVLFLITVNMLIIIQGLLFGSSLITMITYPLNIIIIPYLLYKIVGDRIFEYLLNVIYYTAIFTTMIWLLQVLISPFNDLLQSLRLSSGIPFINGTEGKTRVSIAFIYTITHWRIDILGIGILRNSGLYHEPGAFAYFLIIAIGINTIIRGNLVNRKNFVMSLILLTTFSTAGYLSIIVLFSFAVFGSDIKSIYKVIAVPSFILATFLAYTELDFLQDKIEGQYETQMDGETDFASVGGRVGRVRSAVNLLSTSPLIGRGIISASRRFDQESPYYFTGAGIWRTLASYGIIFTPIICLFYILGIRKLCITYGYNRNFVIFFFAAIAIGATSQRFFMDNITILFFFNGLLFYQPQYHSIYNNNDDKYSQKIIDRHKKMTIDTE